MVGASHAATRSNPGCGARRTEFAPDSGAIADQAFVLRRCRGELDGCSLPHRLAGQRALVTAAAGGVSRCELIFEGGATLNGIDILHRSILLPLSEDGVAIDHVLGAVSYHSLPTGEALIPQVISQTHWF
jgi:hypothetical protein